MVVVLGPPLAVPGSGEIDKVGATGILYSVEMLLAFLML